MHSIQGGPANAPVLVCLPGYGAGAAFYFRNFPSLCEHFKVYAVDLLGNGMSGMYIYTQPLHRAFVAHICSYYDCMCA